MSKVVFASAKGKHKSLIEKTKEVFEQAGLAEFIKEGDLVAIKVHFGERGNTAYLRPIYARCVVEKIKEAGGKPFLVDTNTLYVGTRGNACDHLITAIQNGFDYAVTGAPLIIGDGLTGKDYVTVAIDGEYLKEAKIASAIYHADALIALTHFKGHELTGFGGAIKNVGMGSGSRSAKQVMHSDVLPEIVMEKCNGCGKCIEWCPAQAIRVASSAQIDQERCLGCGECTVTCPVQAIEISWKTEPDIAQKKIAEYAAAVVINKPKKVGFMNFLLDITPDCDCWGWSDVSIVADIGVVASTDIVAVDQASLELLNKEAFEGKNRPREVGLDLLRQITGIDGTVQLAHAERLGLGSRKYQLIKIA
jgi:hypothetical protein